MKFSYTYIWVDADGNVRDKTKVLDKRLPIKELPEWTFDGSSTRQAKGNKSDVVLKPVELFKNPFVVYKKDDPKKQLEGICVLCETYNKDNTTPHKTNYRYSCMKTIEEAKEFDCEFGMEIEYALLNRDNTPFMWMSPDDEEPGEGGQGSYYCSVGGHVAFGRKINDELLSLCVYAGVKVAGTNAEVMASQWEIQIGKCKASEMGDHHTMARWILYRLTEEYNIKASLHCKPRKSTKDVKWNGSGCHTNFSTKQMRADGGLDHIYKGVEKLSKKHKEHMMVYGKTNKDRMCGDLETSKYDEFVEDDHHGVGNRGTSIRIPLGVFNDKKGYLEDRRPGSDIDPYQVVDIMIKTICL